MPREMRVLTTDEELTEFARISNNAYPAFVQPVATMVERLRDLVKKDRRSTLWGAIEGERIVGVMRTLDFDFNYCGTIVPAGGVGGVAVDLAHKKRGVARDMVTYFLDRCEERGEYLAYLYPFRPDFYYQMGFGYGPKTYQFSFRPASVPATRAAVRAHGLSHLTAEDLPLMEEFSARSLRRQHGYCLKTTWELEGIIRRFAETRTLVGFKKDGRLLGYMAFSFKAAHESNFVKNNMIIAEWVWDGQEALAAFCGFLRGQADQINRIILNTHKGDFFYLLEDVRNGTDNFVPLGAHETATAGVGVMYRLVSVSKLLAATGYRDYGGATARVTLRVEDTFRPANARTYDLVFEAGRLRVDGGEAGSSLDCGGGASCGCTVNPALAGGVTVRGVTRRAAAIDLEVDITELASLLMGCVEVETLHRLGRLTVTDEAALPVLDTIFRPRQRPECITPF
jgi:predicted acetyltransferase